MAFIWSSIHNWISGLTSRAKTLVPSIGAVANGLSAFSNADTRNATLVATPPAPLSLNVAEQWSRLSGILITAINRSETAREMQAAATQQLDLAQYGITTLVDELAAVMALPGYEGQRQSRLATVHAFSYGGDVGARPSRGHALAA